MLNQNLMKEQRLWSLAQGGTNVVTVAQAGRLGGGRRHRAPLAAASLGAGAKRASRAA